MRTIQRVALQAAAVSLLTGSIGLKAETLNYDSDLSIMGSYIIADDDRTDEYGTQVRVSYGKRLGDHWWLEPTLFSGVFETGRDIRVDLYQQGLGVDLSYRFVRALDRTTPFILGGVGLSRNDVSNNPASELGGYANVGAGFLSAPFTDSGLRFRAEARYLYDTYDDGFSDVHLSAGITLPIGASRREVVETVKYIEREKVIGPADSDNDGVVDGVDQCPNTLEGLTVNAVGCVETDKSQSVVLSGVTFEFNSDRLTANAKDILLKTADALKGQEDLRVELAGHTDSAGSSEYNQRLSQKRADSVRNHLIDLGIAPNRLAAKGYGEEQPIRSNETPEGRERNRRVEFNVISD